MICIDNVSLHSDSLKSNRNSIDFYSMKSQSHLINPSRLSVCTFATNTNVSLDNMPPPPLQTTSCPTSPTPPLYNASNLQDSEKCYNYNKQDLDKPSFKNRFFRYTVFSSKIDCRYNNLSHGSITSYHSNQCPIPQRCSSMTNAFLIETNHFRPIHRSQLCLDEEDQIQKLEVILARIQNNTSRSSFSEQRFISKGIYSAPYTFEPKTTCKPKYLLRKSNSTDEKRHKDPKELDGLMNDLIRGHRMSMDHQKFVPRV